MTDSRNLGYDPNYGEVRMATDCDDIDLGEKNHTSQGLSEPRSASFRCTNL